jgi:hypothetical protein
VLRITPLFRHYLAQKLTNPKRPILLQPMKVIEYRTVTADTAASLDKNVNAMLAQGFEPYGSPYICNNKAEGVADISQVAQAIVRNGLWENPEPLETVPQTSLAP